MSYGSSGYGSVAYGGKSGTIQITIQVDGKIRIVDVITVLADGRVNIGDLEYVMRDDFNDNDLDRTKWTESPGTGSLVAEQNNRLELISSASNSGFVRTTDKYPVQNTIIQVKVIAASTDGGIKLSTTFGNGAHWPEWDIYEEANYYNMQLIAGPALRVTRKKAGAATVIGTSSTLSLPYYARIRTDSTTVYFEHSSDRITWTTICSEVWDLGDPISDNYFVFLTSYNTPTTGQTNLDDFSIRKLVTGLLDGKIRIKDAIANLLDGKARIKDVTTAIADAKVKVKDVATILLDGKVKVKDIATNVLDGLLSVKDVATNVLDGKVKIKDVVTVLLDGKVKIIEKLTGVLDGKVNIKDIATGIVDGKVKIKDTITELLDGKVKVKDVATILLDGKVKIIEKLTDVLDGILRIPKRFRIEVMVSEQESNIVASSEQEYEITVVS